MDGRIELDPSHKRLFDHALWALEFIPPSNQSVPDNPGNIGYIPEWVWPGCSLREHWLETKTLMMKIANTKCQSLANTVMIPSVLGWTLQAIAWLALCKEQSGSGLYACLKLSRLPHLCHFPVRTWYFLNFSFNQFYPP